MPLKRLILNALKHWRTSQSRRIPYVELNEAHVRHLQTILNRETLLEYLPHKAVVAELGVFRGAFSKAMLERTRPSELHLIDSWEGAQSLKNLDEVRRMFQSELASGKVHIHQDKSIAALSRFPDQYFDWVYIDTDHSYPTTKAELHACARVVKPDGWITGHDYVTGNWDGGVRYGVVEAVNEFCVEHNWAIRYLTAETHRHLSFALQRLSHRSPLTSHLSPLTSNMSADNFYWYASILIFIPWFLIILAPNGRYTEFVAFAAAVILLVAAAVFTFLYLTGPDVEGGFFSLEGFKNLFRSKEMLLTGWLNYLSFCLLVGLWQSHDARNLKIGHIFVIPSLLLTMLTGPSGLLLYLLVRFFKTKKWDIR